MERKVSYNPYRGKNSSMIKTLNIVLTTVSPNIVTVIKSRRLGWVGHVVRMEEGRSAFNF